MAGVRAYKLVRVRRDGTLGPLFVERRRRLEMHRWLRADLRVRAADRVAGGRVLKKRPGWHAVMNPNLPHLTRRGRVVVVVLLRGAVKKHFRPESQGGLWYTAREMIIVQVVK